MLHCAYVRPHRPWTLRSRHWCIWLQDEQPKKKLKVSTKGLSFLDSLPKPKHDAGLGDGNALGGGGKVRAVNERQN